MQALQSVFAIDTRQEDHKRDDSDSRSSTPQHDPPTPSLSATASHTTNDCKNTAPSQRATCKPQQSKSEDRAGGHVGVQNALTETTEEPSHDSTDGAEAISVLGPSTPERDTEPADHNRVTSQHSCEPEPEVDFYSPLRCGAQYHTPDLPSAVSSPAPDGTDARLTEAAHVGQSRADIDQQSREATGSQYWWQVDGLADAPFPPEFRDTKVRTSGDSESVRFLLKEPQTSAAYSRNRQTWTHAVLGLVA